MRRLVLVLLFANALHAGETRKFERYADVNFGEPPSVAALFDAAPRMYPLPQQRSRAAAFAPPSRMLAPRRDFAPADAPAPLASFAAMQNGEASPPDVAGAAGPQHLMVTHNGAFQVQTRTGTVIAAMTDGAFWSTIGRRFYFDPRVVYDHFAARWVIVEAQLDVLAAQSGIAIAVSATDDPTGAWNIYFHSLGQEQYYDYPQLGFNEKTVTISVDAVGLYSAATRREVFLFDKTSFYGGNPAATVVLGPPDSGLTPVTVYDRGVDGNYLLNSVRGTQVQLYRATPAGVTFLHTMNSPVPWSDRSAAAPQAGTTITIPTNDARVANAVLRNGRLWFTHTCFLPAGSTPNRASVQWWKTTTAGEILDSGLIDDATGATFYAYPSIAVNKQDDVVIGFAQFSRSTYASAAYAFRSALDPPGTTRAPRVIKAGEGPFVTQANRWGDYTSTVADPDQLSFWTIQEYAAAPLGSDGRWSTWWAHLPASDATCTDSEHALCLAFQPIQDTPTFVVCP